MKNRNEDTNSYYKSNTSKRVFFKLFSIFSVQPNGHFQAQFPAIQFFYLDQPHKKTATRAVWYK